MNRVKIIVRLNQEHQPRDVDEAEEEVVVEAHLPETGPGPTAGAIVDDEPIEPVPKEPSSNQRSPTRAGTRAKLAEEQAQLTFDQRYSSRGRKIIPKERDDELLFGRKGRKPPTTPEPIEPAGRGRPEGVHLHKPEPEVSPRNPSKRTRTRSLRGYQDDEDSKTSEDADAKEEETSEPEAGRLTPRTNSAVNQEKWQTRSGNRERREG